ncbi:MAG TPA: S-layer homology domain-containing protein [Symbiobacteriaceae bacterium]|jgi:hypothetical protein
MRHRARLYTFLVLLTLVGALLVPASATAETAAHSFSDIRGLTQEPMIANLWQLGVVTGVTADSFNPSGSVTRAQMAALIIRAMGKTADADLLKTATVEFSDVSANHWARGAIALANRMNIIKGDAGKFNPDQPVNYAQAATMLVRALGYESKVSGGYPTGYVVKANELGLLQSANFELFATVSRAEASVLLYNAIYRSPVADTNLTWSQSVFKRAHSLALTSLPKFGAPGQTFTLKATALDIMDNPIPDAPITVAVTSGSATLQNGVLTLGDGGMVTVQAKIGDLTTLAGVIPVSDLQISPATFQANKGGTMQLSATALAGGQRVAVQPVWTVSTGPATVDENGLVTVTDYGTVVIQAGLGQLSALSTGQAVGKVTIEAKPEYLVPGKSVTLRAGASDSAGRAINVPITWSATGAVIDRTTGLLSNPVGAQAVITATAAGISEQVTMPVLQSIQIDTVAQTVLAGKRVTFTATGVDAAGKRYPIQPQWDRSDSAVGIIGADGAFVGTASGNVTITAAFGSLTGRTTLRVSGQPAQINLLAESNSLPAGTGAATTVKVRLLDLTGAVSPVDDQAIVLTLTDTGRGAINRTLLLTRQGEATFTYTAGTLPGTATIGASAPGTALTTQTLSLTTYAQLPNHIELTATPNPLIVGGSVATVTATLKDANNQTAVTSQALQVNLTAGGVGGALIGTSVTIPAGQSGGTVLFISNSQAGTTQISGSSTYLVNPLILRTTTAGPAAAVKIRPIQGTTPVTGLTSLMVQVDVMDASGVVLANDSITKVKLTVTPPAGSLTEPATYTATVSGGTAVFQVPAYTVGTVTLKASLESNAAATDTTTAQFVPGVTSSLRLTAQPASLPADGFTSGQVIAEVVDTGGNVLTNVNTTVTFRKLVEGSATNEVSSLTVPTVGGRAVLTIRSTRLAGTDSWFASAPGLDTQNLATIATSVTSGDAYTMRLSGSAAFGLNTSGTLQIQIVDQQGRVVTGDVGRAIIASTSTPGVTVTPSVMSQSGTASFSVVGTQTTSGSITFTCAGLPAPVVTVPVSFGTAGTAYSLYASSNVTTARVGNQVTLWVRVMDSNGSVISADNGRSISASVSVNGTLLSNTASTVNGVAAFTLTGTGAGVATVTFTGAGLQQPQQVSITFTN